MAARSKDILARLLANENIEIRYGNYDTAFFDVENRVLGLPLWKEMSAQLTDLLIGHEVGHSLFTPPDGWHNSEIEIPGCPRNYINVVEDIRIEQLIQGKYPGLVRCFKLGYKELFDNNFFGTKDREISSYKLPDRINIKAKLRDLVSVEFSDKEQPLVDMCMSVKTWEDVIEACKALYEFMKIEKIEEAIDAANLSQVETSNFGVEGQDVSDAGESKDFEAGEEAGKESEEKTVSKASGDQESKGGKTSNPETVETDEAFREKETSLLEQDFRGNAPLYFRHINRNQHKEIMYDYSEVKKGRDAMNEIYNNSTCDDLYKTFQDETKKVTNLLAKEFEMRKAAYRTQRSQTARSGSLDVNKLHNYKFTDDIFARVTNLADGKSHGMVMMIDLSGSMSEIIKATIKQVLNLVTFCKKVNIPFEVYGFTTGSVNENNNKYSNNIEYDINHEDIRIIELISSSMKKNTFEEAYRGLYNRTVNNFRYMRLSDVENFGGTPLIEVLMSTKYIIEDFRNKFPVEKVNFVLLSDGDGQSPSIVDDNNRNTPYNRSSILDIDGRHHKIDRCPRKTAAFLLQQIQKMGCTTVGFFLAERNRYFNDVMFNYARDTKNFFTTLDMRKYRSLYNRQKFLALDNFPGFNRYFVVKSDQSTFDTDVEDLEIDVNSSKAQITKAFKKYSNSKKGNRVLSAKFAEIIA